MMAVAGAHAAPANFTCATDPLSTSAVVFTNGADVTIRIVHHNGTMYMPIASATVTPSDLKILEQKAQDLAQLGATYDLHIDAVGCTIDRNTWLIAMGQRI